MTSYDAPGPIPSGDADFDVLIELPTAVEKYIIGLREIGVILSPPYGEVAVDIDRRRVKLGHVILPGDGTVEVIPRHGTTLDQWGLLIDHGKAALMDGPKEEFGWHVVADVGWSVAICSPI